MSFATDWILVGIGLAAIGFIVTLPIIAKHSELEFFKRLRNIGGQSNGN